MAKRQTRRSISVTAETYARIRKGAEQVDRSVSGLVEEAMGAFLDGLGVPTVPREEAIALVRRQRDASDDVVASGIFTF